MTMPEWRRRLAKRAPLAEHWRKRHHCTDGVVLGSNHQLSDVEKTPYTDEHQPDALDQAKEKRT